MAEAELKLCPFCGGKAMMRQEGKLFGRSAYSRTYLFVKCTQCLSRTGAHGTKRKAIEAWNGRADK